MTDNTRVNKKLFFPGISISIICIILFSCDILNPYYGSVFEKNLKSFVSKDISRNGKKIIKIAELTDFDWDIFFIIPPYSNLENEEKITRIDLKVLYKTNIRLREDINVLVFVKNNKVIKYIEFPRYLADFAQLYIDNNLPSSSYLFYSKENAIFVLEWDIGNFTTTGKKYYIVRESHDKLYKD